MRRFVTVLCAFMLLVGSASSALADAGTSHSGSPDTRVHEQVAQAVLKSSPAFRSIAREQMQVTRVPFDFNDSTVHLEDGVAIVSVGSLHADRSVVLMAIVDLAERSVRFLQDSVFTPVVVGTAQVVISNDGVEVFKGTIDQGSLAADAGYEALVDHADCEDLTEEEVAALGWCEWVVGALCGTGGGIGCYLACAALGLTTGVGGLGCAGICALIGSLGCIGATIAICG